MTNQDVYDLMSRFERSSLCQLKLTRGDFSLELCKGASAPAAPVAAAAPEPAANEPSEEMVITAPLVGTFYAAPSPDAEPFVQVGSRVSRGQTVCLMEAMKMISEIPAPCDCIIRELVKKNGTLAAFGEVLFRYEPC
jgi:acetyl-CoA carboxylase biotin carboxyl carrier protein